MYDETLNRTKKKQFVFDVRYWLDDHVQSRYFGTQLMGHSTAQDLPLLPTYITYLIFILLMYAFYILVYDLGKLFWFVNIITNIIAKVHLPQWLIDL